MLLPAPVPASSPHTSVAVFDTGELILNDNKYLSIDSCPHISKYSFEMWTKVRGARICWLGPNNQSALPPGNHLSHIISCS